MTQLSGVRTHKKSERRTVSGKRLHHLLRTPRKRSNGRKQLKTHHAIFTLRKPSHTSTPTETSLRRTPQSSAPTRLPASPRPHQRTKVDGDTHSTRHSRPSTAGSAASPTSPPSKGTRPCFPPPAAQRSSSVPAAQPNAGGGRDPHRLPGKKGRGGGVWGVPSRR